MISADAQIYRHGNGKVILGPAGHALRVRPAGKKDQCQSTQCRRWRQREQTAWLHVPERESGWSWTTSQGSMEWVELDDITRWVELMVSQGNGAG